MSSTWTSAKNQKPCWLGRVFSTCLLRSIIAIYFCVMFDFIWQWFNKKNYIIIMASGQYFLWNGRRLPGAWRLFRESRRLLFFKIFSNFVHLCLNFQIFCPFLPFLTFSCPFFTFFCQKLHTCPFLTYSCTFFAFFVKNRTHALTFYNRPC